MIVIFVVCLVIGLLYMSMIASISPDDENGNLTGAGWIFLAIVGFLPVALIMLWMFTP